MNVFTPPFLQSLIWPEVGLNTERDLYIKLTNGAALSMTMRRVHFSPGAEADFGTYYNLFNSGKWVKHCALKTLKLQLEGSGQFELAVFHARPEQSTDRVITEVISLTDGIPFSIDVKPHGGFDTPGTVHFQLIALTQGHLDHAHWQTIDMARCTPHLMLSITTFQREDAVARTVARFNDFTAYTPIVDHLHLTVVDNGQTAKITTNDHVSVIPNANLGGSGGFTRGLLAAQARGATHCLFMDDDAAVHIEAIERTWTFLAYATDPSTAVAGAVANAEHRWQLWENGALFDRVCYPQHMGVDLREQDQVLAMEFASTATQPNNFYGGWWYFAFPVDQVQHMPFPFFVRGDDVSFSLVHNFNIVTLPGVMSFQDEDFSVKETPLTVYLDLRSHMAHHLSLPQMEIGRRGMMKIILRFYLRSLLFCHYDTLQAIGLALKDVVAGPTYFAKNADMSARRTEIAALTDIERWRPSTDLVPKGQRRWLSPHVWLLRLAMKLTLNGHFLPGFRAFGNRITLKARQRGQLRQVWGASEITYVTADGKRSYTAVHSKTRALQTSLPILRAAWHLYWSYDAVRDEWRRGYQDMTQTAFWHNLLGMKPDTTAHSAPKPLSDT